MQIAVIGFRNHREFNDWCKKQKFTKYSDKHYKDDNYNEYYAIIEWIDVVGRYFDTYIEVDYLKEELLKRIARK